MYVCVFVWYAGTHTGMYIYKYMYVCIYTCPCIYNMYLTEIKCSLGLIIYFYISRLERACIQSCVQKDSMPGEPWGKEV